MKMPQKRAQIGNTVMEEISILTKPQRAQIHKLIIPLFLSAQPHEAGTTDSTSRLHKTRIQDFWNSMISISLTATSRLLLDV